MLTTAPYLRIRRPSPTTAEFIVSTLPPQTLPVRLALGAVYFVRLLLALAVLLMMYAAQSSYYSTTPLQPLLLSSTKPLAADLQSNSSASAAAVAVTAASSISSLSPADILATTPIFSLAFVQQILHMLLSSRPGSLLSNLATSAPPWVLLPSSLAALYLLSRRIGAEERLLVLRGLGVQTSSTGGTVFSPLQTRFIPTEKIRDVLINEAFRAFEVRHYLVVAVEAEEHLVVVFPRLLPRPRVVEKVWKGARGCLYGRDGEDDKDAGGPERMRLHNEDTDGAA
ncbi:GPI-GlcNAc transferase complex, PIG-H component-domain-containing protein [Daldinia caldariorum]|uniref:GPI-GlcNAc transferase complex, PIG-H component-domain-containing protein n=1 Tax=Daldinia caldariorum TaxID=326644 RepID=UPI002007375E|nr:GPI-GlcNAc transferase complex, PIG-H component-domain-containing protein [Daldinia caldariorum]KAI1471322.1 GPI-GlcNAc transferase complex, PIG-H component-domain-containing protein [Daldinia caldariorum]